MPAPQSATLDPAAFSHFGDLLRFLRRRAQLSQRDLGIAVGYNFAQICRLEQGQRLPSRTTVESVFVPALALEQSPEWAARLVALADTARQQRDEAALAESLGRAPAAGLPTVDDPEPLEAIPEPTSSEVPRLTLVARLHARLVAERRVALCGLAGIGKTTLAAALAREYAETTAVFWLTFTAGVTTSVEVLLRQLALFLQARGRPEVASLLRATGQADMVLPLDRQIGLLGAAIGQLAASNPHRRAAPLLCFDNAHLVQDDHAIVRVLRHLSATTNASLLLTSRESLQVLPGCPQVRLGGLELNEGLALIANLAGPAAGIAAPAWAAGLLEKTGGSPMLLRLAVAELLEAQVAPSAFIAQLAGQPQIASYLLETVRGHISPAAWGLLTLIAVFRQPLDLHDPALIELIQQADGAEELPAALSELVQRHLIDHPARAQLHPLMRDYAYGALLTLPIYRRQLHRIAAEWSEQGLDDAVEASYHYSHAGDLTDAVATLEDHIEPITRRGQVFAAADMAEVVLAQVRRGRATANTGDLAIRLLLLRGDLLAHTVRAQVAEASYREALELANAAGDRARVVYRLALSLTQRGQAGEAVLICRQAAAALAPDETLLRAQLCAAESQAHMALTDYTAASAAADQALALTDRIDGAAQRDAAEVRARAQRALGAIARYRQDLDTALAYLRLAIQSARQTDLPELLWAYELEEARLLYARGELAALLARCDQLLPRLHATGASYALGQLYSLLALSKITCGELDAGLAAAEQAYAIRQEIGDAHGLASAANLRALALIYLGRLAEARAEIEHVLATYEATGEQHDLGYTLDKLAMIQMLEGDSAAAQATLREALELPAIAADPKLRDDVVHDLAMALLVGGAIEPARQLLAGQPPPVERQIELDHQLIVGLIALASGDQAAAQVAAQAVAERANQSGYLLHVLKAGQLAKAAANPPPLVRFPHLLWVIELR